MEALDKLSVVGKTEEFTQSLHVASELLDSIVVNLKILAEESNGLLSGNLRNEQIPLAQQLQSALFKL